MLAAAVETVETVETAVEAAAAVEAVAEEAVAVVAVAVAVAEEVTRKLVSKINSRISLLRKRAPCSTLQNSSEARKKVALSPLYSH